MRQSNKRIKKWITIHPIKQVKNLGEFSFNKSWEKGD